MITVELAVPCRTRFTSPPFYPRHPCFVYPPLFATLKKGQKTNEETTACLKQFLLLEGLFISTFQFSIQKYLKIETTDLRRSFGKHETGIIFQIMLCISNLFILPNFGTAMNAKCQILVV